MLVGYVQDLVDTDHLVTSLVPQLVTMTRACQAQELVLELAVLALDTAATRAAATPRVLSTMPLVELLMTGV